MAHYKLTIIIFVVVVVKFLRASLDKHKELIEEAISKSDRMLQMIIKV